MKDKNSFIILSQLNSNSKNEDYSHICPQCNSVDFSTGAGLKPGQMSLRCSECKAFIGYRNLENLQRLRKLRRQKQLTPCLELLEKQGLTGDAAIFVLSAVGGAS